jgi:hypothetical protein
VSFVDDLTAKAKPQKVAQVAKPAAKAKAAPKKPAAKTKKAEVKK